MPLTIQQVIDTILKSIPGAPFEKTVDTIKAGDPSQPVTGIVTTFLANQSVLQQAADLGANFVITHETPFYNHQGETDWLEHDAVYQAKRRMIAEHNLVIWHFHDYWHAHKPDGIVTGVLKALDWEKYVIEPNVLVIPPTPLRDLAAYLKTRLGSPCVRVIGPPEMVCHRVGLSVGAHGGHKQIGALGRDTGSDTTIDTLVAGEINEWEVTEYVRDARHQGRDKALIVVGHAASEEPGMAYLVEWLAERIPGVAITHIPTGDPFRYE